MSGQLSNTPLLVDLYRGFDRQQNPIIERAHHGIIAVVDGLLNTHYEKGDINIATHMRSCAKLFQIVPLIETGFFDNPKNQQKFGLKPFDPALIMSSHAGQTLHTSRVKTLLEKAGLDHKALHCGAHSPYDSHSFCELKSHNMKPTELHNNCSGKHAGMLFACLENGYDLQTYEQTTHPLQKRIKEIIALVSDITIDQIDAGIDGCSLPSFVLPMRNIALMYARLSLFAHRDVKDAPAFLSHAFRMIWKSIVDYPEYLAGQERFDTDLIRAGNKKIISKAGADGILALSIAPTERFPHGLGIAIKVADGDAKQQIRPLVAKELLSSWGLWPSEPYLLDHLPPTRNFRGITVGSARCYL